MNPPIEVGEALDSQLLYERQKALRASKTYLHGPTIIAAGLEVPENVGSVLRLADAAGSERVIFLQDVARPSYPLKRLQRTARSTEALVRWEVWTEAQFLEANITLQPTIALELTTASTSIFETDFPAPCAFMIGSERYGVPVRLLAECQQAVHIPMYGMVGSMNVTHALAVALFEWHRQHSE